MTILNRTIQPEIQEIKKLDLINPVNEILTNRLPVYIMEGGTQDIIRIEFIFNAGIRQQHSPLEAELTNKMLLSGTFLMTANEIADKIDFYGAFVETTTDYDSASLNIVTLVKYLEPVMSIVSDVIINATYPIEEFNIMIKNEKQKYEVNNKKVNYVAKQHFDEIIFGKMHPYGMIASENSFKYANTEMLRVFYRKKYLNSYYKIIVSGRVPNNCIKLLNNYFGYESTVRKNLNVVTSGKFKVPKSHKNFIQRDNALQSAIRIGCKVENITHKDFIPLKILNTVLGGYFGSRLMTNLREDKGYTYGIGSRVISFYDTGLFFITSEVDANATKDALVQIYKEIKTIREKLIDKEELELVKNFMLGTLLRAADGPFAQSSMLKNVIEYNLDLSYYTKYTEEIKSITSETLRDIANKYLEESKLVELVVGKL